MAKITAIACSLKLVPNDVTNCGCASGSRYGGITCELVLVTCRQSDTNGLYRFYQTAKLPLYTGKITRTHLFKIENALAYSNGSRQGSSTPLKIPKSGIFLKRAISMLIQFRRHKALVKFAVILFFVALAQGNRGARMFIQHPGDRIRNNIAPFDLIA